MSCSSAKNHLQPAPAAIRELHVSKILSTKREHAHTSKKESAEMNADASTPKPEIDDTWEDLDPRHKHRQIRILAVHSGAGFAKVKNIRDKGPTSKIRLDRFRATRSKDGSVGKKGYILISRATGRSKPISQPDSPVVPMQDVSPTHSPLGDGGCDGVLREAMNELHPGIDLD
jgi:hypothetical protein